MKFDRLNTGLALRILFMAAFMGLFFLSLNRQQWYVTGIVSGAMTMVMAFEIIRFARRSDRKLALLLTMIKQEDFSSRWKNNLAGDDNLNLALGKIITEFENVRMDRELHHNFLQLIIGHISIALICYDEEGKVELFNKAARELFRAPPVKRLSELCTYSRRLPELLKDIEPGRQKIIKSLAAGEYRQLLVKCTGIRLQSRPLKLVSLQDIKSELDEKELESWQKIIRVLTHEIMNSVTPISSLSEALNEMINPGNIPRNLSELQTDEVSDLYSGLHSIENRSRGLARFVGAYKELSRMPEPDLKELNVKQLLSGVFSLMKPELEKAGIASSLQVKEERLSILADKQQIEQVLINLVKNSIDAIDGQSGMIMLEGMSDGERTLITVTDNGKGIDNEIAEDIFVPFFTTKKKGSGIGLSISRQIMRLHGGSIFARPGTGHGTVFTLEFLTI
jgi:two-component system, NtrC family, nitrogen regulation sensor histidine kinase NtrY